jgi:hypothetical protein
MAVDPSPPLLRPAPPTDPAGDPLIRLSQQLHALSRVAETLTVRLLEVEERLALQQERLQPLIEAADSGDPDRREAMDQRLEDTEQRLAQLEELLHARPALRPLPGLRRPGHSRQEAFSSGDADPAVEGTCTAAPFGQGPFAEATDPFPEEGEQPFMDERVA